MADRIVRVLDLFCGAGGFSLGFAAALSGARLDEAPSYAELMRNEEYWVGPDRDFEIFGVDLDWDAIRTYHYNLNRMYGVIHAVRADVRMLPFRIAPGYFDIIIGGPPCQPWSRSTPKHRRGWQHPLADLTLYFFLWVAVYQPRAFVLEQVPGLLDFPEWREFLERLAGQKRMDEWLREE